MKATLHHSGLVIVIGALALAAGGCGKKGGPPPPRPVVVKLAAAIRADTPVVMTAYGTVQDRENVNVVPQVSGILTSILVQEGAVVTNGQPLFLIDPRDYQMRVDQAAGMLAVDRSNLDLARATLQRNQSLLEKHLISTDQFDTLKARVTTLEAQLTMDEAALNQARLNLSRCTITAPISGICSKRYLDAGNLASAGLSHLINIRSYNPLRLECAVSEQFLPALRRALTAGPLPVSITPRGDTNSYPGTVSFLDNAVNPATGTILLRGDIPNPALSLWANQFVDVRITLEAISNAVMVPESAVQIGKGGAYLYAVGPDQKAILKPVKTGIRHDDWIQITEGLAAGETVVALGQLMLYPGATVMDPSTMTPKTDNLGKK